MTPPDTATPATDGRPWWRHGYVWLVLSGPAAVVVASLVTFGLVVRGSDPVVTEDYYRQGGRINEQLAKERAQMPASQARNHAATPVVTP